MILGTWDLNLPIPFNFSSWSQYHKSCKIWCGGLYDTITIYLFKIVGVSSDGQFMLKHWRAEHSSKSAIHVLGGLSVEALLAQKETSHIATSLSQALWLPHATDSIDTCPKIISRISCIALRELPSIQGGMWTDSLSYITYKQHTFSPITETETRGDAVLRGNIWNPSTLFGY